MHERTTSGLKAYGCFAKFVLSSTFVQRGIAKQGEKPVQLQTRGPLGAMLFTKFLRKKYSL